MPTASSFIPANISRVKIFPPIGIARVGDSGFDLHSGNPDLDTLEHFLPSEIPGRDTLELVRFSLHSRVKLNTRKGVRFRVYAYDADGQNIGEIIAKDGYKLTWTVHVANHKASYELFRGMYEPRTGALRNPDVEGDRQPEDRDRLIVDPGPKTIASPDFNTKVDISGKFHGSRANGVDVHLGQLRTNEEGHLIFIGGAGYSRCVTNRRVPHPDIVSEFDSADWIDDTCDGWVKVLVDHDDLSTAIESSSKATVLSAPPKFAWGVRSPTTWYDRIEDIYAKQSDMRWRDDQGKGVEFYRDIWPILQATYAVSWTNQGAFEGHGSSSPQNPWYIKADKLKSKGQENKVFRQAIFNRLRAPEYTVLAHASTKYMPRLSGNDGDAIEPGFNLPPDTSLPPIRRYAALTALQYERFSLWNDGKFASNAVPWKDATELKNVELKYQPACLTLAALDHTVGEPLYPGIEVYWIARDPRTYVLEVDSDKDGIDPPFRINHEVMAPGYLTRGLSMPWQSDFDQCNSHWWPTVRPDDVINERHFIGDEISEKDFIDKILPRRQSWTRGIRISPSENAEYFPGSTDMVKYWSRLGFVVKNEAKTIKKKNGDKKDPTWLETEREKIVRKDIDKKTQLPVAY
ncbi:hypothetical protein OG21DRAFT_1410233 [Imleria badia]|nr:hypothetical protein OG21DRAFT_1410233 [Imleria badia]